MATSAIASNAKAVKNWSPSRLDIKQGKFPAPTVSDGNQISLAASLVDAGH